MINYGQNDKEYRHKLELNNTINLELKMDSVLYKFQECPKCYRLGINDSSNSPLITLSFNENGDITRFSQSNQNKIGFVYDENNGRLMNIYYRTNKGKLKLIKLK